MLIRELLAETDETCEYALYVLGLIARQEGNVAFSLELFQKAMQLNPNSAENRKQLARSLFLLGKHKAALEAYTDTLSLSPNDWVGVKWVTMQKGLVGLYLHHPICDNNVVCNCHLLKGHFVQVRKFLVHNHLVVVRAVIYFGQIRMNSQC